jgi:hypothetical protein
METLKSMLNLVDSQCPAVGNIISETSGNSPHGYVYSHKLGIMHRASVAYNGSIINSDSDLSGLDLNEIHIILFAIEAQFLISMSIPELNDARIGVFNQLCHSNVMPECYAARPILSLLLEALSIQGAVKQMHREKIGALLAVK